MSPSDSPYLPPQAPVEHTKPAAPIAPLVAGPRGLGGWLALVGLGLIIGVGQSAVAMFATYLPIFKSGQWLLLTQTSTPGYHPLWASLVAFELCTLLFSIVASLALLVLFFSKSWRFPRLYSGFLLLNLILLIADFAVGSMIPAVASAGVAESVRELARGAFAVMIWVPYMRVSVRVRNTFRPHWQLA